MNKEQDEEHCFKMPHSIPRGLLTFLIVKLLRSKEMNGTEIMSTLEKRSKGQWRPSPGSVYPVLAQLEKEGIIETARVEGRSKTYRLSEEGQEQFHETMKKKKIERKVRLGRLIWLQLLDPHERAHFYLSGIIDSIELLDELIKELSMKDRKRIAERLEKITTKIQKINRSLMEEK